MNGKAEMESCAYDSCESEAGWKFILRELNICSSKKDDLAESFLDCDIKFPFFFKVANNFLGSVEVKKLCSGLTNHRRTTEYVFDMQEAL
jgi:hypothetical protein